MDYGMLLQILNEAEARADDETLPSEVRERSNETANLVYQRLEVENISIDMLHLLAAQELG